VPEQRAPAGADEPEGHGDERREHGEERAGSESREDLVAAVLLALDARLAVVAAHHERRVVRAMPPPPVDGDHCTHGRTAVREEAAPDGLQTRPRRADTPS